MKKTILNLLLLFSINSVFAQEQTQASLTDNYTTTEFTDNQKKYAKILGVDVVELKYWSLYNFIDEWLEVPYLANGATKIGINASSFTQRLYVRFYDIYLERTVQEQFNSNSTELFKNKEYLEEGDLIFFGKDPFNISYVAVYLHNNKFIHSTSDSREGPSGVKISDLTTPFWSELYVSAGRRKGFDINYREPPEPKDVTETEDIPWSRQNYMCGNGENDDFYKKWLRKQKRAQRKAKRKALLEKKEKDLAIIREIKRKEAIKARLLKREKKEEFNNKRDYGMREMQWKEARRKAKMKKLLKKTQKENTKTTFLSFNGNTVHETISFPKTGVFGALFSLSNKKIAKMNFKVIYK